MAPPHTKTVDNAGLEKSDEALALVLSHWRLLLRIRNQLCSSLLRLPTETIVHILTFVNGGCYPDWQSIFRTCHQIHRIMRKSAEVWQVVNYDCTARSLTAAHISFRRSKGTPRALVANFDQWSLYRWGAVAINKFHERWRAGQVFRGSELHTLEFAGNPATFYSFSWILEGPLPRLERLQLHIVPTLYDGIDYSVPFEVFQGPFSLKLPQGMPLRVLDLCNVTLPWSSNYFTGLRELRLEFISCIVVVAMLEDELLGIFDASPQLERLSLEGFSVGDGERPQPKRVAQLPSLASLCLVSYSESIGYILAHMDTPAITSLKIFTQTSDEDAARALSLFFPDDRLPKRLFSDPPIFKIETRGHINTTGIELTIGSFEIQFKSNEYSRVYQGAVVACIPLVPSSVTTLQVDLQELDQRVWRDFFRSHPGVRSIECHKRRDTGPEYKLLWDALSLAQEGDAAILCHKRSDTGPGYKSLWDALSLAQEGDAAILCQNLESIRFNLRPWEADLTPLFTCLRDRDSAGFKLRHLNIDGGRGEAYKMVEDFRPLVEVLEVKLPSMEDQKVSRTSTYETDA